MKHLRVNFTSNQLIFYEYSKNESYENLHVNLLVKIARKLRANCYELILLVVHKLQAKCCIQN